MNTTLNNPQLFCGIGLRSEHMNQILEELPPLPFLEILVDNYLNFSPVALDKLTKLRESYALSFHCVSMNLGSTDPLDISYFEKIKKLADILQPFQISDHVCFTAINNTHHHDLLPVPYTEEALQVMKKNIIQAQDRLKSSIAIENPSSYLSFNASTMPEWEFFNSLPIGTGCELLLDLNNVYVSGKNHGYDPREFIDNLTPQNIAQFHLAGFEDAGTHLIDSHSRPVFGNVWKIFSHTVNKTGPKSTLIEWDNDIPELKILFGEVDKAEQILQRALK